jgi:uncharacterized membrane protein YdbT with pleckstrin-like domain
MFRSQPLQFVLGAVLCLVVVGLPVMVGWWLKNKGTRLTITNRRSTLRKGILSKQITEVWHRDVRNVQLSQTVFQRIFGVGRLAISSSGQDGMEIDVNGIPLPSKAKSIIDANRGR